MAKPVGVVSTKTKDNSRKKFREHAEWMEGKKIGRPKQRWVDSTEAQAQGFPAEGYWEKVA